MEISTLPHTFVPPNTHGPISIIFLESYSSFSFAFSCLLFLLDPPPGCFLFVRLLFCSRKTIEHFNHLNWKPTFIILDHTPPLNSELEKWLQKAK